MNPQHQTFYLMPPRVPVRDPAFPSIERGLGFLTCHAAWGRFRAVRSMVGSILARGTENRPGRGRARTSSTFTVSGVGVLAAPLQTVRDHELGSIEESIHK